MTKNSGKTEFLTWFNKNTELKLKPNEIRISHAHIKSENLFWEESQMMTTLHLGRVKNQPVVWQWFLITVPKLNRTWYLAREPVSEWESTLRYWDIVSRNLYSNPVYFTSLEVTQRWCEFSMLRFIGSVNDRVLVTENDFTRAKAIFQQFKHNPVSISIHERFNYMLLWNWGLLPCKGQLEPLATLPGEPVPAPLAWQCPFYQTVVLNHHQDANFQHPWLLRTFSWWFFLLFPQVPQYKYGYLPETEKALVYWYGAELPFAYPSLRTQQRLSHKESRIWILPTVRAQHNVAPLLCSFLLPRDPESKVPWQPFQDAENKCLQNPWLKLFALRFCHTRALSFWNASVGCTFPFWGCQLFCSRTSHLESQDMFLPKFLFAKPHLSMLTVFYLFDNARFQKLFFQHIPTAWVYEPLLSRKGNLPRPIDVFLADVSHPQHPVHQLWLVYFHKKFQFWSPPRNQQIPLLTEKDPLHLPMVEVSFQHQDRIFTIAKMPARHRSNWKWDDKSPVSPLTHLLLSGAAICAYSFRTGKLSFSDPLTLVYLNTFLQWSYGFSDNNLFLCNPIFASSLSTQKANEDILSAVFATDTICPLYTLVVIPDNNVHGSQLYQFVTWSAPLALPCQQEAGFLPCILRGIPRMELEFFHRIRRSRTSKTHRQWVAFEPLTQGIPSIYLVC